MESRRPAMSQPEQRLRGASKGDDLTAVVGGLPGDSKLPRQHDKQIVDDAEQEFHDGVASVETQHRSDHRESGPVHRFQSLDEIPAPGEHIEVNRDADEGGIKFDAETAQWLHSEIARMQSAAHQLRHRIYGRDWPVAHKLAEQQLLQLQLEDGIAKCHRMALDRQHKAEAERLQEAAERKLDEAVEIPDREESMKAQYAIQDEFNADERRLMSKYDRAYAQVDSELQLRKIAIKRYFERDPQEIWNEVKQFDLDTDEARSVHSSEVSDLTEEDWFDHWDDHYSEDGFNRHGFDRKGFNRDGWHVDDVDKDGNLRFGDDGYDPQGYNEDDERITREPRLKARGKPFRDEDGYDPKGFDLHGFNREGYDIHGYTRRGYNKFNQDSRGNNPFDKHGFDKEGYDRFGYNSKGFDEHGYNRKGFDSEGRWRYRFDGLDAQGYNRFGFDKRGFDRKGIDRDKYQEDGFDAYFGINREGFDRFGRDKFPDKKEPDDRLDYDLDSDGYDWEGYDLNGYDEEGFNRQGLRNDGYDWLGNFSEGVKNVTPSFDGDKAPIETAPVDQTTVDQITVEKPTVETTPLDKLPVHKSPLDKTPITEPGGTTPPIRRADPNIGTPTQPIKEPVIDPSKHSDPRLAPKHGGGEQPSNQRPTDINGTKPGDPEGTNPEENPDGVEPDVHFG